MLWLKGSGAGTPHAIGQFYHEVLRAKVEDVNEHEVHVWMGPGMKLTFAAGDGVGPPTSQVRGDSCSSADHALTCK